MATHPSPTRDSKEFWEDKAARETTLHTLRIRVTAFVSIFLMVLATMAAVFLVKVDEKFSTTQSDTHSALVVVGKIRDSQVANSVRNGAETTCTNRTGNDLIHDIVQAFVYKDSDIKDYSLPGQCVLPPLPKAKAKK